MFKVLNSVAAPLKGWWITAIGVACLALVLGAWVVRIGTQRDIAYMNALLGSGTCTPEASKLLIRAKNSGTEQFDPSLIPDESLAVVIAGCQISEGSTPPIVKSFEGRFSLLSPQQRVAALSHPVRPSSELTRQLIQSKTAGLDRLDDEALTALLPAMRRLSPAAQVWIREMHSARTTNIVATQLVKLQRSMQSLAREVSLEQWDEYANESKNAASAFANVRAAYAVLLGIDDEQLSDSLESMRAACDSAADAFQNVAARAKQLRIARHTSVAIGREIPGESARSTYEAMLISEPTVGRILVLTTPEDRFTSPGLYSLWLYRVGTKEVTFQSGQKQSVFAYEVFPAAKSLQARQTFLRSLSNAVSALNERYENDISKGAVVSAQAVSSTSESTPLEYRYRTKFAELQTENATATLSSPENAQALAAVLLTASSPKDWQFIAELDDKLAKEVDCANGRLCEILLDLERQALFSAETKLKEQPHPGSEALKNQLLKVPRCSTTSSAAHCW